MEHKLTIPIIKVIVRSISTNQFQNNLGMSLQNDLSILVIIHKIFQRLSNLFGVKDFLFQKSLYFLRIEDDTQF
jgi:hypothetical protein